MESSVFSSRLCFCSHSHTVDIGPKITDDKTEVWRIRNLAGVAQLGGNSWVLKGNGNYMM